MNLKSGATRRRGAELESAILDAAWLELTENGYSALTFEAVAARAGTSRTVLYRRWPDRGKLMLAVVRNAQATSPIEVPETGDLRADVITLLQLVNEARAGIAAVLSAQLGEYFRESGTSPFDVRERIIRQQRSPMEQIIDLAAARGELDTSKLTARVIQLPTDLMRHELLMRLKLVPAHVIVEIVDQVWFPLLRQSGALVQSTPSDR